MKWDESTFDSMLALLIAHDGVMSETIAAATETLKGALEQGYPRLEKETASGWHKRIEKAFREKLNRVRKNPLTVESEEDIRAEVCFHLFLYCF